MHVSIEVIGLIVYITKTFLDLHLSTFRNASETFLSFTVFLNHIWMAVLNYLYHILTDILA